MTEQSLEVAGLGYRYPRSDADVLREVDLTFPTGSFTVVMGPTGAGKSTLLMTLNGVIPQLKEGTMTGHVRLDGADLADFRVPTITRYVGLVLQDPDSQLLGRTVAEDVAFGPRNHLVPRAEITQRVVDCLAAVALSGFEDRETAHLSGGEKQRLAIAGILASQPQVLCLDEPTSELDPQGRDDIYQTVDALRRDQSATIIAVEHAGAEVAGRADHLVVLNRGAVAWRGAPTDFFRDPELARRCQVKPLAMSVVGAELVGAGLIDQAQVPLDVASAERLIRQLAGGRALAAPEPPPPAPSAGPPIVELRDVQHRYPDGQLGLDGVSLTLGRGEYVALVGRNGAGKTTLAKHLNGLLRPTAGTALVAGGDAAGREPWELARQVGYVFQNPDHQIFGASVADEVRYGLKLAGLAPGEIEARIDEVLEFTGLTSVRDEHPFSLGKGERQRIAVASILALRPEILVVDEPTTGQDWAGVQAMMTLIDRLHAAGTTIVMVTHDIDLVAHHANRVIVLDAGRVVADGPTAQVLSEPEMLAAAAVRTTETVELSLRLWPDASPVLDEARLGAHLAEILAGARCATEPSPGAGCAAEPSPGAPRNRPPARQGTVPRRKAPTLRLERLDVRVKLAAFAVLGVAMVLIADPLGNVLLLALLLGALLAAGTPLRGLWAMVQPLLLLLGLVAVASALTSRQFSRPGLEAVWLDLWGLQATVGGLAVGLNFVVRVLLMVVATWAFTISTPIDDLLEVLTKLRAPYWLAILVTTALTFVPTMIRKKDQIIAAQRARGARVRNRGPIGQIVAIVPIMVPLITNSIQLADGLAIALTNRGYGATGAMTSMRDLRLRRVDLVVLGAALALLGLVVWLRFGLGLGAL